LFAIAAFPLKLAAFPTTTAIALTLLRDPLSFLISCGLRLIYQRLHADRFRGALLIATVFLTSIGAGLVDVFVGRLIGAMLGEPESALQSLGIFCFRSTLYIAWGLLYFWIKAQLAARERELSLAYAETAARDAELQLMRAQVDPHFLFNALNTVLATLAPDQAAPRRVVEGLAAYLRYSLQHRHDTFVPLHAEFEATLAYLAVEQERFRDELVTDCRLDPRAKDFPVPGVLLQPLVENAVKYARQTSEPPYRIRLQIDAPEPGLAHIEVANAGDWIEPAARPGPHGNGLVNLRQRLALLYPSRHELATSHADGWVRVTVRLSAHAPIAAAPSPHA